MLNPLEGQPPPHIIDWLVDELGENIVARVLGAHYAGLRAGDVGWDSLDAEVMQSLRGLVNGALAVGAVMPAPPEPDAGLQPAVESPADGPGPEANDEPEQRSAQTAASAAVPDEKPDGPFGSRRRCGSPACCSPPISIEELLSGPRGHMANEIADLRNLRRRLWSQAERRQKKQSRCQEFLVAVCMVEHLMISRYRTAIDSHVVPNNPPEAQEALLCDYIHTQERTMRVEKAGRLRVTRILWALGLMGEMPVDEAIRLTIKEHGTLPDLQIEGELLSDLLRQGREGCVHYRHVNRLLR